MKFIDRLLPANCFEAEVQEKSAVVLHFTAGGNVDGAWHTFASNPARKGFKMGTAYIVDPHGTVHRLFDPKGWAYHLGIRPEDGVPGNETQNKRTVGIELVNWGPLRLRDGRLCSWPGNFSNPYCAVEETQLYHKLSSPYRGEQYFAAFSGRQITAAATLVASLCDWLRIPKQLPRKALLHATDPSFAVFRGVCSHVNFRKDKTDLAPIQAGPIWQALLALNFKHEE